MSWELAAFLWSAMCGCWNKCLWVSHSQVTDPGTKACSWTLYLGFLVERLNSLFVSGGREINSVFVSLQNNWGELVRNTSSWMLISVGSGQVHLIGEARFKDLDLGGIFQSGWFLHDPCQKKRDLICSYSQFSMICLVNIFNPRDFSLSRFPDYIPRLPG